MKFTPSISKNTKACFAVIARLIVSSHFIYELVDKISRYTHWKSIIASQAGLGAWSLWLIIVLLFLGSTSLVLGRYLGVGTFALCLFQIPTSIMFEDSLYESFDSMSACGGVIAIALLYTRPTKATGDSDEAVLKNSGAFHFLTNNMTGQKTTREDYTQLPDLPGNNFSAVSQ